MSHGRFTPDLDVDGLSPEEAFATLGNDIRLEIIRVLWRAQAVSAYDDGSNAVDTMSYSQLQAEVGIEDNGKFNYHLSRLEPQFLRRTDDGYRLSGAGKRIARTVVAVSGPESVDVSEDLDMACPLCGGTVSLTYDEQWLRLRCTDCAGLFGDQAPTGTLFLTSFPAAGMAGRAPSEALDRGLYRCALDIIYLLYGLCRECAGPITASVTVCDDHDSRDETTCRSCGTPFPVWGEMRCSICGFAKRLPLEMFATGLVMATGMLDNQSMDLDAVSFEQSIDLLQQRVHTEISRNPLQVSITIEMDTQQVTVTFDDDLTVIDVETVSAAAEPPSNAEFVSDG